MPNKHAITIKFVEAIWDACPWMAPAGYVSTKDRKEAFMDEVFRKGGINREKP